MKVSFSRVDCWKQCPRKYKFKYIDQIETEPDYSATNPLVLGSTIDLGIQKGYEEAEKYYWSQYHVASDEGETELMKIEHWLKELRPKFNKGEFQVKIESDRFIGFADYIEDNILVDFKYSNNVEKYAESPQLHVYASELPTRPEYMAYVCIPKTSIRQKQFRPGKIDSKGKKKKDVPGEDITDFRRRVMNELNQMEIKFVWVDYDQEKVDQFWKDAEDMKKDRVWEPAPDVNKCKWCDYNHICQPKAIVPDSTIRADLVDTFEKQHPGEAMPKIEPAIVVKKVRTLKPRSELKTNY